MSEMPERIYINKDPYSWGMYGCSHSPVNGASEYIRADMTPKLIPLADAMELVEALNEIQMWSSFPRAKLHDGTECSYGVAYGSNGERDFMRKKATEALSAFRAKHGG